MGRGGGLGLRGVGVAWRGVAVRVCVCVCGGVAGVGCCGVVVLWCCGVVASSPLPHILAILACIVAKTHGNDICLAWF